jgi:putative endonuclease
VVGEGHVYHMYVLRSLKDGKQYTGSTSNLANRLKQHNSGQTRSTKRRRPFEMIYAEEYQTREEAEARERYLKTGKGREELRKILLGLLPNPTKKDDWRDVGLQQQSVDQQAQDGDHQLRFVSGFQPPIPDAATKGKIRTPRSRRSRH